MAIVAILSVLINSSTPAHLSDHNLSGTTQVVKGRDLSGVYRVVVVKNIPEVNKTCSNGLHREDALLTYEDWSHQQGYLINLREFQRHCSPLQKLLLASLVFRRLKSHTQIYYTLAMRDCQEKILSSYVDPECCITLVKPTIQSGFAPVLSVVEGAVHLQALGVPDDFVTPAAELVLAFGS